MPLSRVRLGMEAGHGQSDTHRADYRGVWWPKPRSHGASDMGVILRVQDTDCGNKDRREDVLDHLLMDFLSILLFQT